MSCAHPYHLRSIRGRPWFVSPNRLLIIYIAFSYLVFLRNFLFGHRAKDSNLDLPLIVGPCYHYTTLLIPAILLLNCTDSSVISCTHGILNMALYSLLNSNGRNSKIRTCDLLLPRQARYQTAPYSDILIIHQQ